VPSYVGSEPLRIGPIVMLPQQILILVTAILLFLLLEYFYRRTLLGKAFRAVAHSAETASLMGINSRLIQLTSYAVAASLAGLAGFMVVPLTLAEPQLGTVLGLKAFAIAIIAGLGAPGGILLSGLAYGALEGLISGYLNTGLRDILGFSLMILVLFIRPEGLFSKVQAERA
jgi:branched-chain amino acid transport system permease protein